MKAFWQEVERTVPKENIKCVSMLQVEYRYVKTCVRHEKEFPLRVAAGTTSD